MKRAHRYTSGLIMACATTLPVQVSAQPEEEVRHGLTHQPVVVTATRQATPLKVITNPKEFNQTPVSDGADYLKKIPGFSVIRNGGANGDPVLRGMFGSRLNILTDGSTLLGACGNRMDAPTSYISPENYDELTVIKGPQTVTGGPGASAGTIRFEHRAQRFDTAGIRFDGSVLGGAWGRNEQRADLTVGAAEGYLRLMANQAHAGDYADGAGQTVPSGWDKWNTDVALGWTPAAHTRLELSAGTGDGAARYAGRGMDGARFKRNSFGLRFEKKHLSGLLDTLEAQIYYNHADHVMDNYTLRPVPSQGPKASEVERQIVGARLAATLPWGNDVKLVSGLDAQTHQRQGRFGAGFGAYESKPWTKQVSLSQMGFFNELTWYMTEHMRVISGARLDWVQTKDHRPFSPTSNQQRHAVLPSAFMRYERDLNRLPAMLYIGIGHVARFPDYWELFSPDLGPTGSLNAFAGIQPEKTTQLDLGARYVTDRLQVWTSAYLGYVNNFILFKTLNAKTATTQVNGRIMGGELGASWQLASHWSVENSLAYAWGENTHEGKPLPQMPPLDTRFGLRYDDSRLSAGAIWRLVAAQQRYALAQGNVVGKDLGRSAGFGLLSLNAGYQINKIAHLAVGIDNVLNKNYAEHLNRAGNAGFGYPTDNLVPIHEPGRMVWARLRLRF
ncbi:TonB-dependent copper receptor [Mycoavidus cysteinexigens]|nr:TonB-dependent copper receptor [Mycoavidus cysteinexigens]